MRFVDNYDSFWQPSGRFANGAPDNQVIAAIGFLLCGLGTACIYYGTEQGFSGQGGDNNIREAMFDKSTPSKNLLNTDCDIYQEIAKIAQEMRSNEPLRFGRMYYRQISGDGENFGFPFGSQYTLAFSRLLYGEEVSIACNVSGTPRNDFVIVDAASKTETIWREKDPSPRKTFRNTCSLASVQTLIHLTDPEPSGCPPTCMRTVSVIEYAEAQRIVGFIVDKAAELHKAVAIAVADAHGELIAFARMDGVPLPSVTIAMNKAWTAARTGKSTQEIGEKVKDPSKGHDISYYGDPRFVGWGGGVPVRKGGEVVGAVAVSGLSSKEDAALATLGADLIKTQ